MKSLKTTDQVYTSGQIHRIFYLITGLALLAFIYVVSPEVKFPLVLYKLSLVSIGSILGLYLDMMLFPNFRPKDLLDDLPSSENPKEWINLISASLIRRAFIMLAVILGISLGV